MNNIAMPSSFYTLFLPAAFFVLGLILGSFFNVCILRIPRKKSISSPPSHCPSCGNPIKWYDNVPIFSYILLRGKCRNCNARISIRYPLIELLSGLLFLAAWYRFGLSWYTPFVLFYLGSMVVMGIIDLEHFILPNRFTLALIPAGLLSTLVRKDMNIIVSLVGILVGGGLVFLFSGGYYLLKRKWGMGGGDVKLMAGVGAFLGGKMAAMTLLLGTVLGMVVALPLLLKQKKQMDTMIPFGPFLCVAAIIVLFFGEEIFEWWMKHPLIDLSGR